MAVISAPGTRSVGSQIGRAAGLTLGTLAAVGILAAGVTYGAGPASEAWARVAGDPGITLAEGATLADAPGRAVQLTLQPVEVDAAGVAAAFGGPAREIVDPAEVAALSESEGLAPGGLRYFSVPTGVVSTPRYVSQSGYGIPTLRTAGAQVVVTATTAEDRAALVRRMAAGLGATSGGLAGVDVLVSEPPGPDGRIVTVARPAVDGVDCSGCGLGEATAIFDEDGVLLSAWVAAMRATATTPIDTLSAAEAFDALRHHRGEVVVSSGYGPVVTGVLTPASVQPGLDMPAFWTFYDASGEAVGSVVAQPGRESLFDE